VVRNKIFGKLSHVDEAGAVVAVDLRNRLQGVFAGLRTRVRSREVPDEVLAERVKAKLGRVLSHPGSVEVAANRGTVTLTGIILTHEADRVLKAILTVPGVCRVTDQLEQHKEQGNVPALQGGRPRVQRVDIMQEHWSPAAAGLRRHLMGAVDLFC
jgi:hypothetical protein